MIQSYELGESKHRDLFYQSGYGGGIFHGEAAP